MNCPKCNAPVKDGMKFCPSCGCEMPKLSYCPKCGNEIKDGMSFCSKCGYHVHQSHPQLRQLLSTIGKPFYQKPYIGLIIVAIMFFGIVVSLLKDNTNSSISYNSDDVSMVDSYEEDFQEDDDPNERYVMMDYVQEDGTYINDYGVQRSYAKVLKCESNYPRPRWNERFSNPRYAYSGVVTVPAGERWVYDRYEYIEYTFTDGGTTYTTNYYPLVFWGQNIETIGSDVMFEHVKKKICSQEFIREFSGGDKFRIGMRIPATASCTASCKVYFKLKEGSASNVGQSHEVYRTEQPPRKEKKVMKEFTDESSVFDYLIRGRYTHTNGQLVMGVRKDHCVYYMGQCVSNPIHLKDFNTTEAWFECVTNDDRAETIPLYVNLTEKYVTIGENKFRRGLMDKTKID